MHSSGARVILPTRHYARLGGKPVDRPELRVQCGKERMAGYGRLERIGDSRVT